MYAFLPVNRVGEEGIHLCTPIDALSGTGTMDLGHRHCPDVHCLMCCTPAFLRDHDEARDGVSMYLGQSQQVIVDGCNSRGVLIESRFVFDACFTRTVKTGPKNTALTA